MILELQPVILAAGEGSKMYPLTENKAKCLLPIANVPMICYTVNYLEKYGFVDYLVIVRSGYAKQVHQALQHFSLSTSKFEIFSIPDEDDTGTAEALVLIKDKIKNNLLVMSCDMITDSHLHQVVDIHRMYDASLTAVFANHMEVCGEKDVAAGSKSRQKDPYDACRDIISIESDERRILFYANESDLEQENIVIKKSLLKRYPNLRLRTDLVDCHLFIMKKWLLEYLADNDCFESLKSDFLPHVVRKQFSKRKKKKPQEEFIYIDDFKNENSTRDKKDIFTYMAIEESLKYASEWSGYKNMCLNDQIQCHAFHTDAFCLRVNTLTSYTYINRQIERLHGTIACNFKQPPVHISVVQHGDSQIGKDCLIGEHTTLGRKKEVDCINSDPKTTKKFNKTVTIKRSVLGKHCCIGNNVRINNSIIMDHVTIGDGCIIQGCIICDNVCIQANSSLSYCQVSFGQTVRKRTTAENESIVQEEMEFEDDEDNFEDRDK